MVQGDLILSPPAIISPDIRYIITKVNITSQLNTINISTFFCQKFYSQRAHFISSMLYCLYYA